MVHLGVHGGLIEDGVVNVWRVLMPWRLGEADKKITAHQNLRRTSIWSQQNQDFRDTQFPYCLCLLLLCFHPQPSS